MNLLRIRLALAKPLFFTAVSATESPVEIAHLHRLSLANVCSINCVRVTHCGGAFKLDI